MASLTPPTDVNQRNEWILEHVSDGTHDPIEWSKVDTKSGDHSASFFVMSDALKIGGIRVSVTARVEQQAADILGCLLMTPKIADLLWSQRAVTLLPTPRVISSATSEMIKNSQQIDAQLAAQGNPGGLRCTVGKHWVLTNLLDLHRPRAVNYGWHFNKSFGGSRWASCVTWPNTDCRVIQDPGWAHDIGHVDYSQVCVLVRRDCVVDGVVRDLADVLKDKELAPLASHEGVLRVLRQPGVPIVACKIPIQSLGALPDVVLRVFDERMAMGLGYGEDGTEVCKPPPPQAGASYGAAAGSWPWWKTALVATGVVAAGGAAAYGARRLAARHARP